MEISKKILDYISKCIDQESDSLKEITTDTEKNIARANMTSGHYQGIFLSIISKIISPNLILEIGTFTGYSAICLAEGLNKNGKVYTIEKDPGIVAIAKKNISKTKFKDSIIVLEGDAKEIINGIDMIFDLVFIDANKNGYIEYYNKSLELLRHGGCILVDNVLWKGEVTMTDEVGVKNIAKKMHHFNEYVTADSRVEKIILPIRDGIFLIRKI